MRDLREIRDPIHGFILRSELEQKIIDTSPVQRLRGIRQLALANLVYPGSLHTRFEHSLGVMHIAGKLADRLIEDPERKETIRLAGLLHDIGHGPFSHVSESILDQFKTIEIKSKKEIHEQITTDIIGKCDEIRNILGDFKCDWILGYLSGTSGEGIEKGIISGPLDADKQDYLLRDSYFCGVKYGVFDSDRLIQTLQPLEDTNDHLLAASKDGVHAIEQFVIAKYHMSTQVYRHKIRLITDSMITRAIELGIIEDKLDWLIRLYQYNGSREFIDEYQKWDDARLSTALLYPLGVNGKATELFWRLKNRRLFKVIFSKKLLEIPDAMVRDKLSSLQKHRNLRLQIEAELAEYLSAKYGCPIPKYHIIVKQFTIKSVREQSRNNEGSIIIITTDGPRKLEEESTLFRSIDEKQNDAWIEVYAPLEFKDSMEKRKALADLSPALQDIISKIVSTFIQKEETKGSANGR